MLDAVYDARSLTRHYFGKLTRLVAEAIPPPERAWSDADWRLIGQGHTSADMDGKWNAFVEGTKLYLHRSWTGRESMKPTSRRLQAGGRSLARSWKVIVLATGGTTTPTRPHCSRS